VLNFDTVEAALATSAVSITLNRTAVARGLRAWLTPRVKILADLSNCPYCISHWVGGALALQLTSNWYDWAVTSMAIVGMSVLATGLSYKLLHWDEIELEKQRDEVELLEGQLATAHELLHKLTKED
jgi:hypothetical protein